MALTVAILLIVSNVLPLVFAWQIWQLDEPSRAAWLISVAEKVAFVVLIVLVSRWDIAGVWTRIVLVAIVATSVAVSVLPDDPARFRVYGNDVVSPSDGEVREAVDGHPDLPPPTRDPENPAGNHIVIACGDIVVTLAHLSPGSADVDPGDRVGEGQPIAEVGNSGNSAEPHLHIHAVNPATGRGVPLTFDGRHPIRNRIYSD